MNKPIPHRLPPALRLLVFATLANAISLPCLPDDSASVASTIPAALATLVVLALFFSGQRRRLLATRLVLPGVYGLIITLFGFGLEGMAEIPDSVRVVTGLILMARLPILALAFWKLLADFGYEDCLGLANLIPGLTEYRRRSIAIQLWLPWHMTRRFLHFHRRLMTRRKHIPGSVLDFRRHWRSWQACWYSLRHELEMDISRLEYRLPPPDSA